jgi:hypothetical protein
MLIFSVSFQLQRMIPSRGKGKGNSQQPLPKVSTHVMAAQRRIAGWAERQALSDVEEVAHSQSLHLTNLRKAMRLRVFIFPQPKMHDGPQPVGRIMPGQLSLHVANLQNAMLLPSLASSEEAFWFHVLRPLII